jgi:hypothetical protein
MQACEFRVKLLPLYVIMHSRRLSIADPLPFTQLHQLRETSHVLVRVSKGIPAGLPGR